MQQEMQGYTFKRAKKKSQSMKKRPWWRGLTSSKPHARTRRCRNLCKDLCFRKLSSTNSKLAHKQYLGQAQGSTRISIPDTPPGIGESKKQNQKVVFFVPPLPPYGTFGGKNYSNKKRCFSFFSRLQTRGVIRQMPALGGYPPTLGEKRPGTRHCLRVFWAGTQGPV